MMLTRLKPLGLPAVLALSLSACAQLGMEQPHWPWDQAAAEQPQPRRAPEPQPMPAVARPAAKPAPELSTLRPAPRPAVDKEAGVVPSIQSPKLVGLSEAETAELLGRPAEENVEPPGKVWVYKASGCKLSVHLFPDMEKGGFYTLDYTADGGKEACLGKVAGEARKRGSAVVEESARRG